MLKATEKMVPKSSNHLQLDPQKRSVTATRRALKITYLFGSITLYSLPLWE